MSHINRKPTLQQHIRFIHKNELWRGLYFVFVRWMNCEIFHMESITVFNNVWNISRIFRDGSLTWPNQANEHNIYNTIGLKSLNLWTAYMGMGDNIWQGDNYQHSGPMRPKQFWMEKIFISNQHFRHFIDHSILKVLWSMWLKRQHIGIMAGLMAPTVHFIEHKHTCGFQWVYVCVCVRMPWHIVNVRHITLSNSIYPGAAFKHNIYHQT